MLILFLIICTMLFSTTCAAEKSPITYHLSFETLDFLEDDYVKQLSQKTPEDRNLKIVDGRFGSALSMGAVVEELDEDGYNPLYLDMITTVTIHHRRDRAGHDEPFLWGSGRLHPAYGSVAFWVKGPDTPCTLFEQTTTSWGRTERQLIEIHLHKDASISAYVEDARYVQHKVWTKPLWKSDTWHHILFTWDRSSGVELWVNGTKLATTMGNDAWWDNQKVGLFHLPMTGALYDEFYIMNRPLTPDEIKRLYTKNIPPSSSDYPYPFDTSGINRLKEAFTSDSSLLPVLKPSDGKVLLFTKITPERIHDEGVAGWCIDDGRYESAWPHEYGIYTDTPGDVDFHAEKADLLPPAGAEINYVTFEGNLDGVVALKGDRETNTFPDTPVITVPGGKGFFFGGMIEGFHDAELRIPFTKEYGTPPGFQSDILRLPLSGDLRIHEAGLFNVSEVQLPNIPGDRSLFINEVPDELNDTRYSAALQALLPSIDRTVAGMYRSCGSEKPSYIDIAPMTRLNLFSEPAAGKMCYKTVILDMWVTSPVNDNVFIVKITNPALPSQTWSHAEVRLNGFTGEPSRLRLALSFDPLCMVHGDRLWLQLLATDGLSIVTGDRERPARVIIRPEINWIQAELKYSFRSMLPNRNTYSGMFEWMPWGYTKIMPDVDAPEHFGGPFDMVYPWQAVLKVNPGDRIASIYKAYGTLQYASSGRPRNLSKIPHKSYDAPANAPDWAVYFRELQTFRNRIITWWRHHQKSDGQVGGGWNDDTLVFSRGYSDLPLDSNPDALALYNNVFDGFDKTNYFKDGYCRIWPIDDWHNGDFVRERYKSLMYNTGDPRSATWAMEEAWRWDKPDQTPVNFGDGNAFLFGKDVLEWYWNKRRTDKPYELSDREKLVTTLRQGADLVNEITLWRYTEARVHTDDQRQYGSDYMHDLLHGGWSIPPRTYRPEVTIIVGVGWIEGGGPDLGRLVEYSGYDGLRICMYSFDLLERNITARLFRLDTGDYSISLGADYDNDGSYEKEIFREKKHIRRFDRLSLSIPPKVSVMLTITQIKADPDPGALPDLAVSGYYVQREGSSIKATIHNIGCAPTGQFTVSVLDPQDVEIAKKRMDSLPGAEDFVPKQAEVTFRDLPGQPYYILTLDKENKVTEIFEENNSVKVLQ